MARPLPWGRSGGRNRVAEQRPAHPRPCLVLGEIGGGGRKVPTSDLQSRAPGWGWQRRSGMQSRAGLCGAFVEGFRAGPGVRSGTEEHWWLFLMQTASQVKPAAGLRRSASEQFRGQGQTSPQTAAAACASVQPFRPHPQPLGQCGSQP